MRFGSFGRTAGASAGRERRGALEGHDERERESEHEPRGDVPRVRGGDARLVARRKRRHVEDYALRQRGIRERILAVADRDRHVRHLDLRNRHERRLGGIHDHALRAQLRVRLIAHLEAQRGSEDERLIQRERVPLDCGIAVLVRIEQKRALLRVMMPALMMRLDPMTTRADCAHVVIVAEPEANVVVVTIVDAEVCASPANGAHQGTERGVAHCQLPCRRIPHVDSLVGEMKKRPGQYTATAR